jgi:hypothetical protein
MRMSFYYVGTCLSIEQGDSVILNMQSSYLCLVYPVLCVCFAPECLSFIHLIHRTLSL